MKPGKIKINIDPNTLSSGCRNELEIKVKAYAIKKAIRDHIGNRIGQWYTVQQVEIIFSKLAVPYVINDGM